MLRRTVHKPGSDNSNKKQNSKKSTRLQKTKRCHSQKKYQLQSIDQLMDSVAVFVSERKNKPGQYFFSKIDLK